MYSVCILIYVSMYLWSYLSTRGISGPATGGVRLYIEVRQKMMIYCAQRYTWRPYCVSLEMHLEAMMEWGWRCTCRWRSSEHRNALGHNPAGVEVLRGCNDYKNLETTIERDCRCTCTQYWCEVAGHHLPSLETNFEGHDQARSGE